MCEKRTKWKTFAESVIFLIVISCLFIGMMCLFRTYNYNREQLDSIRTEDAEVVYIGGSAAFTYWQPHKAWKDFGFSSYVYGSDTLQAEAIKYYIKEAEKTQDPSLYVIDARPFQYWEEEVGPDALTGLQYSLDAMNVLDPDRFSLAYEYWKNRTFANKSSTPLPLLSITKEHENTANLGNRAAWDILFNKAESKLNGHLMVAQSEPFDMPLDFMTENRAQLHPTCKMVLTDLLSWCKEQNHNVLFVACPYVISEEHQAKYNSISDLVSEYGYNFLNTNMHYAEMDIDFYSDFYNGNHVNAVGAEKYTAFLADYIHKNYSVPSVTDNAMVELWASEYEYYETCQKEAAIIVQQRVANAEMVKTRCMELKEAQNLASWSLTSQDPNIVLLIAQSGIIDPIKESDDATALCRWGFTDAPSGKIAVITDTKITDEGSNKLEGTLDIWETTSYSVYADNNRSVITVDGTEYILCGNGIQIVAFDNCHRKVADAVQIRFENDTIIFQR